MPLRDKKKFFINPLFTLLLLLVVLGILSWPFLSNISKKKKIDIEIAELQAEIGRLEAGNSDIKKLLSYLKSDQFAETQARLNFGLKKPGEEVVVVKSDESLRISPGSYDQEEESANPAKWLKYFLKMK